MLPPGKGESRCLKKLTPPRLRSPKEALDDPGNVASAKKRKKTSEWTKQKGATMSPEGGTEITIRSSVPLPLNKRGQNNRGVH